MICDQRVMLNGVRSAPAYPEHLRRVCFKDPASGKTVVFLTNNTALPALTIAALYKSRWQIELFFKWIKQHLRIKRFLGTGENAVKTQVWCAVATYVLIAIVKKELRLEASPYPPMSVIDMGRNTHSLPRAESCRPKTRATDQTHSRSDWLGSRGLLSYSASRLRVC